MDEKTKAEAMRLEELAELHERISTLESADIKLSRRITAIEDGNRGHSNDDPMSQLFSPSFIWAMVIITMAPVVLDLIKEWRATRGA